MLSGVESQRLWRPVDDFQRAGAILPLVSGTEIACDGPERGDDVGYVRRIFGGCGWPGSLYSAHSATAPSGLFNGLIWPKDGCASSAYATTARPDFLPLPAAPSFLAQQQSRSCAILRCAPVASDVSALAPGLLIAIEAAMVRVRKWIRRPTMATIGTFKKTASNEFTGDIITLSVQAKNVRIVPDLRANGENAPSHRVLVGRADYA